MGRIVSLLLMLFWGLWFGGTIALFIFVSALFRQSRELAIQTTPVLFITFERYHLVLAALAGMMAGAWLAQSRTRMKTALFVLVFLAAVAASISAGVVTPRIMALRQQNQIQSVEFKRFHGISMMVYSSEAVMLLIAGIVLAVAMRQDERAGAGGGETNAGAEVRIRERADT
jgi:hypothetical protein